MPRLALTLALTLLALSHARAQTPPLPPGDFGGLKRYKDSNAALQPPASHENRVIFFGDSITELWKLDQYFPDKHYLNRGIVAQTTTQMLVRFRHDVIELQPKIVVILAGTNDLSGITGPMSVEDIEGNYASFAELARANHIKVIFASVLPVHAYTKEAAGNLAEHPPEKIAALNRWLKEYVAKHSDCGYLDYYTALVDDKGYFKKDLADADGIHPNDAGYKVMAALAEKSISKPASQHRILTLGPPEQRQ